MSWYFAVLLPEKALPKGPQRDQWLRFWVTENSEAIGFSTIRESGATAKYRYVLSSVEKFFQQFEEQNRARKDCQYVQVDIDALKKYVVMDWGIRHLDTTMILSLAELLASAYPYGQLGILQYWVGRFTKGAPPISDSESLISQNEIPDKLENTRNKIVWLSLKEFSDKVSDWY